MSEKQTGQAPLPTKESLIEAYTSDPERLAARREELEVLPLADLAGQNELAVINLHDRLSHDPRAINTSSPDRPKDDWQVTLPPDAQGEAITVQANQDHASTHLPFVHVYAGEASAAWQANPTLQMDHAAYMANRPVISMGGQQEIGHMSNSAYLNRNLAGYSFKDVQNRVNDILLLETLAEQFTPAQAPEEAAAQAGKMAVQAQVG